MLFLKDKIILFTKDFFQVLLEFNEIDEYRDKELDKYLNSAIYECDDLPIDTIEKVFSHVPILKSITQVIQNTQKLINDIEADKSQKAHILKLKKDKQRVLNPLINKLEENLFSAKAIGNKDEMKKLETALMVHKLFLHSPNKAMNSFKAIQFFLISNKKLVSKIRRITPKNKKEKEAKETIERYLQAFEISKFYEGYEIITDEYEDKIWHSCAIKIYKLMKAISKIEDNVLKEKVEYLFEQFNKTITLNTTRLNKADLFTFLYKQPIWTYENNKQIEIDKEILDKLANEKILKDLEKAQVKETNDYYKVFNNIKNSLFFLY